METALPEKLLNNKSGKLYKQFIKNYSGSLKPTDFATYVCQQMDETANYSRDVNSGDIGQAKKSVSGKIFELIIAEILKQHGITPFYMQAVMWGVPNSKFDFLCFDEKTPVILSAKISLAERWRQSAFEGYFLKQVYRQAKVYVITNDKKNAAPIRNKDIENNEISGVDYFYHILSDEMNNLVDELKLLKFKKAKPIDPVSRNFAIIE